MRILSFVVSLALAGVLAGVAHAQIPDGPGSRGPRFLVATTPAQAPRPLDVARTPVLRKRIALDLRNVTLAQGLAEISQQAGLHLMYSKDVVPLEQRVTLEVKAITVAAALTELLLDANVDVLFSGTGQAVLVRRRETGEVLPQAGAIVGRVTDVKTGEPLVGAEVYLEGTRWRATTAQDGRYRLAEVTPGNYTLVARRVGYGRQSRAVVVAAEQEVTVEIALQPVATQLNEIVTTVTGEQRRVELGHVVGRINADSLAKEAPVSSLSELLTGRVPGLQVFQRHGTVGGRVSLQVRGPNSLRLKNEPIVIIDGVRYTDAQRQPVFGTGPGNVEPSSALNDININDIESIEVVKGPSAATLYGTDAANGVLVITTKRGQVGPTRWNVYAKGTATSTPTPRIDDIYWGWGTVNGVPNNPTVSCTLARLANGQCTRQDSVTVLPHPLNDPEFTILGTKPTWEYGVNVSGGRQDLRYHFSGDFQDATGPIQMPHTLAEQLRQRLGLSELPEEWREPNAFAKLNLRSNITAVLGRQADLRVNTGYIRADTRTFSGAGGYLASYFLPIPGSPYGVNNSGSPSQVYAQTTSERTDRFLGSASGQWQPLRWLATRATLGLDLTGGQRYGFARPGDQPNREATGAVEDSRSRQLATTAELGVTATARRGRLTARTAFGTQYVRTLYTASGSLGRGLAPGQSVPMGALTLETNQQYREAVVLGGYLEEMLGLNERVFLTGALRVDGASTFGRDFEAAVYPKAGTSWLLSEEPFLPRLPGLDELRLRYAFGVSGKQPDPTWARSGIGPQRMRLNGQTVNVITVFGLGNPELEPERVREHEFGFDVTALDSRVTLDLTWFRRRTAGMIVSESGPPGRGPMFVNLGLVTQRGFEAQVQARVLDTRHLSWDLRLQHANYTTMLADIGRGSMLRSRDGGYVEGYPLGARFNRPIVGWQDVDGDGLIDNNATEILQGDTAVYMGQSIPPRSQTLTSVLGLFDGRLRLSALLERKSGFTQVNSMWCNFGSRCRAAVDRSTPFAEQVKVLGFLTLPPENGDFTRLREVSAALTLPAALTRVLHLGSATLVVSARNLALWTDFSGPDPEVGNPERGSSPDLEVGGTASGIPLSRMFSFRLDLGF